MHTDSRTRAFSLVELLTVIFIISLLIGILIPSINNARNAAKKLATSKTIDAIKVGLEMFKNDNGPQFRQTNGYPPSFSHPRIPGYAFNAYQGRFPFLPDAPDANPQVYGAHWLPAMLMGVHQLGYVKRSTVPIQDNLRKTPSLWYSTDTTASTLLPLEGPLYVDPGNIKTRRTKDLPGRENPEFFPDWNVGNDIKMRDLPVIVDAFDQPILYYAANTHGRTTNMLEDEHLAPGEEYPGGPQREGVPFYFHQDNEGFTGTSSDPAEEGELGWDFGGRPKGHAIGESGAQLPAADVVRSINRETFARYIVDRKIYQSVALSPTATAPLRPVNADGYLLISAGPDGRYGTNDDVNNLPPWPD